jgi:hypothetical protein
MGRQDVTVISDSSLIVCELAALTASWPRLNAANRLTGLAYEWSPWYVGKTRIRRNDISLILIVTNLMTNFIDSL